MRRFLGTVLVALFSILIISSCSAPVVEGQTFVWDGKSYPVSVSLDERIFTVYAYMNVAGYSEEQNGLGMHPVRQKVRDRLSALDPAKLEVEYMKTHPAPTWAYAYRVLMLGNPPRFAPQRLRDSDKLEDFVQKSLKDLPDVLGRFYAQSNISELHKEVLRDLNFDNAKLLYEKELVSVLKETLSYLRWKGDLPFDRLSVVINPLDTYWRHSNYQVNNLAYIVVGPVSDRIDKALTHELIHLLKLVDHDQAAWRQSYSLLEVAKESGFLKKIGSASWKMVVEESLDYAISLRLQSESAHSYDVLKAYNQGLILVPFFVQQLQSFEAGNLTWTDFASSLADAIDVKREIEKWEKGDIPALGIIHDPSSTSGNGIRITTVESDEMALRPGDVLLAIDDQQLATVDDLKSLLLQSRIGSTHEVTISRDGQIVKMKVALRSARSTTGSC